MATLKDTKKAVEASGVRAERAQESMIDQSQPRSRRKSEPTLEEARLRQQALGSKLRQMFNEVVNEPVPEDFLEILRRADNRKAGE